jgi:hypothetical protein
MCGLLPLAASGAMGSSLGKAAPFALGLLPGLAINAMNKKKPAATSDTTGSANTMSYGG